MLYVFRGPHPNKSILPHCHVVLHTVAWTYRNYEQHPEARKYDLKHLWYVTYTYKVSFLELSLTAKYNPSPPKRILKELSR